MRKKGDEGFVRGGEAQRREFRTRHPSHFLAEQRPWRSYQPAAIKAERHCLLGIGVRGREHESTNLDIRVQLLADFAPEGVGVRLVFIDLSAGELPQSLQVDALLSLRNQKAAVAFDDGGADDQAVHEDLSGLKGNERQLLVMGQIRHLGFLATQTIAPKSISAWLKSNTCR